MEWNSVRLGRGKVLVPTDISRLPDGLWLHAACRPVTVAFANRVGAMMKLSTRLGLGRPTQWDVPLGEALWKEWIDRARTALGVSEIAPIVAPAIDPHRARFHALLLDGDLRQVGFARFTRNPHNELGLAAEREFTDVRPVGFWSPRLIEAGTIDGWTFNLGEALIPGPHRPAKLLPAQRREISSEIRERLSSLLGDGRTAAHCDFAPWNVRRIDNGPIAVLDWEEVRPAPKAADELWHTLTAVLSSGGSSDAAVAAVRDELDYLSSTEVVEAAEFWALREVEEQPPEVIESGTTERSATIVSFKSRLAEALDRLSI